MAPFVLAHLSDPHIAPLPAPRLRELLGKRITGYLNWRAGRGAFHSRAVLDALVADLKRQAYAHLAVTGDLVNIALPNEFAQSRAWLKALGDAQNVTLVPGNHDAYVPGALAESASAWGDYMRGDDQGPDAQRFPFVRRRGAVSLIGVSSAVATPWFNATGTLGHTQLARLAGILAQEKQRGAFRVVLIHHPPRLEDAKPHKRLVDAPALGEALRAHGAELILHGHNHRNMRNELSGPDGSTIPAIGVASASAINDGRHHPAAYNLFEIDGAPNGWRCRMTTRGFAGPAPGPVSEILKIELI